MSKPSIIVVDDEAEVAALIAEVANMVGFDTEVVVSAKQLLQAEATCRHDVMVIDLFMPDTDGFELIEVLAERRCKAAIILVTGYDKVLLKGAEKIARAKGLHLLGIMAKPFQLEETEALLQQALYSLGVDRD